MARKRGRPCSWCGGEFLPVRLDVAEFCSPRCRLASWRADQREAQGLPVSRPGLPLVIGGRECQHCGGWLTSTRPDARYCGAACRQAARRAAKTPSGLG